MSIVTIWSVFLNPVTNIDWSIDSVLSYNYPLSFCNLVTKTFNALNFVQFITFPTRRRNTFDIFATIRPSLVEKYIPIPGIGDHESVLIESLVIANYIPPVQTKSFFGLK